MQFWQTRTGALVLLLAVGMSLAIAVAAPTVWGGDSGPLFGEPVGPVALVAQAGPQVVQRRLVSVNAAALERASAGSRLQLNVFEAITLTARLDSVQTVWADTTAWTGRLENDPLSHVTLVQRGERLDGLIASVDSVYEIRSAGDGLAVIAQLDQSAYPPEGAPIPVDAAAASAPATSSPIAQPLADDGSVIDVLVLYTPAARTAAGGVAAIENIINLAIAGANQSYANSAVTQRLNLVGMSEVTYSESGDMGADLARLRATSDGFMDEAHTLRNSTYADEVALLVESGQYCGIAYLMATVTPGFASSAFAVVARDCAVGNYSFAHELGHNMGANHDWFVDTSTAPYTYAHGYVNATARWRTIMAYNNRCSAQGFNCSRLNYWSNPGVQYNSAPMGVPPGSSTACSLNNVDNPPCDAQDQLTLNNTALTVANFRARPAAATATSSPTRSPTPTATRTPTPTRTGTPFPDLVVQSLAISLETGSACNYTSTQLGVRAVVSNDGNASAGPFQVSVNGTPRPVTAGLPAGQTTAVWAGGYVSGPNPNSGVADSAQQVVESDETNNQLSQALPIPTLPPTCTPPPPPQQRVFLPLIRR